VIQIFKRGQVVQALRAQKDCFVGEFIGGGGQGEVYKALLAGEERALKWYYPRRSSPTQRNMIEALVDMGPPSDRFLWPEDICTCRGVMSFGYTMPLRGSRFMSIIDLMKRRCDPTFSAITTTGYELANSFLQLHMRGLAYRDISFGNVFFDPVSGEIRICDNDNIDVNGAVASGVLGTPQFMAPEIVRCEAGPSIATDQFSLSVLLFYIFVVHHPLEGKRELAIKCMDAPARKQLYGDDPLFIYDSGNDSNRPVARFHDNAIAFWEVLPGTLRALFTKSFTEGLKVPQRRVVESEWRTEMVRLRDSIVTCSKCQMENFLDGLPGAPQRDKRCWSCKTLIRNTVVLRLEGDRVVLKAGTKLFLHHTHPGKRFDFAQPVAEVVKHPSAAQVYGLKNTSQSNWNIVTGDSHLEDVVPGRSVKIAPGLRINFGTREGTTEVV
jgi:eukaryotic-like serine/threonine-protein kinase